jgi:hypothetical protein
MQVERVQDALLARSRREIRFAAPAKAEQLERDAVLAGPLEPLEMTLVRETADGFVDCPDDVIPLLIRIGEACASRDDRERELEQLQRDCIVALWRVGKWRAPAVGIRVLCEACCKPARLTPQRRNITVVVPWGRGCLDDPGGARRGSRRFDWAMEDVRIVRHVLVGPCCTRRSVVRCHHEHWIDSDAAGWGRCARLAVGADYCPLHRSRQSRDERGRYDWTSMPPAGARRVVGCPCCS